MRCPNCNSKDIGKIGSHQFYCWGCFIELQVNGEKMSVYQVEEDGTLSSLDDLFFGDEMAQQDLPQFTLLPKLDSESGQAVYEEV
ncbi:hypothetical protein C1I59_18425 [Paenibacillus polymyxa]|nr:hypothetical protein [Paenibacillus polymyxa]TKH34904.1 hypothetical protein C1I59_18425 [Paenibacillus polymyxa]